jgi:hypothetical protein
MPYKASNFSRVMNEWPEDGYNLEKETTPSFPYGGA